MYNVYTWNFTLLLVRFSQPTKIDKSNNAITLSLQEQRTLSSWRVENVQSLGSTADCWNEWPRWLSSSPFWPVTLDIFRNSISSGISSCPAIRRSAKIAVPRALITYMTTISCILQYLPWQSWTACCYSWIYRSRLSYLMDCTVSAEL